MPTQSIATAALRSEQPEDSGLAPLNAGFNSSHATDPTVLQEQIFSLYKERLKLGVPVNQEQGLLPAQQGAVVAIDARSAHAAGLDALTQAIADTQTEIGREALRRSIFAPPSSSVLVQARQAAVQALDQDPTLCAALTDFLSRCAQHEQTLLQFIDGTALTRAGFAEVGAALADLQRGAKTLAPAAPPYIAALLMELEDLPQSRTFRHFQGDLVARGQGELLLREEVGWLRRLRSSYYAGPFDFKDVERTALTMLAFEGCTRLAGTQLLGSVAPEVLATVRPISAYMGFILAAQFCFIFNKQDRDSTAFFQPLREALTHDASIQRAWEAVALLDEILTLRAIADRFPEDRCFAQVEPNGPLQIQARALHPLFFVLDPSRLRSGASIANDLHLSGEKILALSGAAGGAHDNLIASAVQSQVLALLGAAVPAQEYCCGIPDQIVVQTDTGLGAQASETRTNLERLSPASLWVLKTGEQRLDPERRSELGRALDAANQLQIPVLFVSSDPQLLNLIATNEPAIAIARRFSTLEDGRPGYRLEPGISWGAERLAAGDSSLTRQELEALLEQRGALQRSLQRWEHN